MFQKRDSRATLAVIFLIFRREIFILFDYELIIFKITNFSKPMLFKVNYFSFFEFLDKQKSTTPVVLDYQKTFSFSFFHRIRKLILLGSPDFPQQSFEKLPSDSN